MEGQVGLSRELVTEPWSKKAIFRDWKQGELVKWNLATLLF